MTKFKTEADDLSGLLSAFSKRLPSLDARREEIDLLGATAFSPFTIFDPGENTLSRVLAELFDPRGSHGQGFLFLNALLTILELPRVTHLETVRVRREATTRARRRIDIVIETANLLIGIENKPWAAQQPRQLADYHAELSDDLRGRKPVLIFLSDQDAESAADKAVKLPYYANEPKHSLHGLLNATVAEIKAQTPKAFVVDFLQYIASTFGGTYVENRANALYVEAVNHEFDNPGNRRAIATVLLSQHPLHTRILNDVGHYILQEVREKVSSDFQTASLTAANVSLGESLMEKDSPWGLRRPGWPEHCIVALESQKHFFSQIIFGVKAPVESTVSRFGSPARKKLAAMSADIPGSRKSTADWPWYRFLPESYWGQEYAARLIMDSPTASVDAHPDIQDLARQFVEIAAAVNNLLGAPHTNS